MNQKARNRNKLFCFWTSEIFYLVDSDSIDDDEKPPQSVLDKLARPDKRSSQIRESSNTQKLNTDDIRLCTINRANPSDTYGFGIDYDEEGNYHSLKLIPGRDNKTSSKNFIFTSTYKTATNSPDLKLSNNTTGKDNKLLDTNFLQKIMSFRMFKTKTLKNHM
jgi:hypothetical protein